MQGSKLIRCILDQGVDKLLQKEQEREEQRGKGYCQLAAKVGLPVVAGGFVLAYWITGLTLYYFPNI